MAENKNMEELKNKYKMTEIGKISVLWKKYNFGEIIDILTDYHANGSYKILKKNVELMDTKDYAVMIRTTNFEQDDFEHKLKYITEDAYNYLEKSKVFPNDILMNKIANAGSVYLMPDLKVPVSLAMNLFLIRINKNNNPIFVYYFLKFKEEFIKLRAQGTVTKTITKDAVRKFPIYLPPLEIQEKIATILSALDDKIEINNEMNKTLEEMAQTLFKRWFIDFEFPNGEGEPYKSSGGKMVESELGEIPEGWEVSKIENMVNIKRGASPRPIQEFISNKGIPWIKISDATSSISKFLNKTNEFIIEKGKEKSRFIKKETLILSNSATPGIPMITNLDACVHDGWLIFSGYKNITKEFLYYILKYHKENILALSNGSVFRNLKTDILKNYKIILPNIDLIIGFNQNLEDIDKYIKNNVEETQSLKEIRDTLLPKLMSGEIEV